MLEDLRNLYDWYSDDVLDNAFEASFPGTLATIAVFAQTFSPFLLILVGLPVILAILWTICVIVCLIVMVMGDTYEASERACAASHLNPLSATVTICAGIFSLVMQCVGTGIRWAADQLHPLHEEIRETIAEIEKVRRDPRKDEAEPIIHSLERTLQEQRAYKKPKAAATLPDLDESREKAADLQSRLELLKAADKGYDALIREQSRKTTS